MLSLAALAVSLMHRSPFQWFDGRRWHMLAHQYNSSAPAGKWGQRDDEALGAYAHSLGSDLFGMWETFFATSGKPGSPPPAAYTRTVAFDDGSAVRMLRRERPKVLLDAESKRPTHLFTGVCPPSARSPGDKTCFTMVQRIGATPNATKAKTDDSADSASGVEHFVDCERGSDSNPGSSAGAGGAWKTVQHASASISAGDTVTLSAGICNGSFAALNGTTLQFGYRGPPKSGTMTVYRAAKMARVIFTRRDGTPPDVAVPAWTRLEGLWLGGRWTPPMVDAKGNVDRGGSSIALGGYPGHKELLNCTLFGYREIDHGSTEMTLLRGNRLVQSGAGKFAHGIYYSGGNTPGQMGQHAVFDRNIVVGGEGCE